MKKIILLICLLILSAGCNKQQPIENQNNTDTITQEKNDSTTVEIPNLLKYPDWQKYCSEKFRFEIHYPKNWINDIHAYTPEENNNFQFFANSNEEPQKRSYFSIFTTNQDVVISEAEIKEKKNIKLIGYDATSYTFTDNDKRLVFKNDDIFFHFMIENITVENKATLDNILSSFRFLSDSEECHEVNKPGTTILGNKIYYYGEEIGSFTNGKIFISFQGNMYSFSGNPEYLKKHEMIEGVYFYKDISMNLPDSNQKEPKIIYKCSSSLLPSKPYYYCDTNGKNSLIQYEFGEDYRQFSTGGGFPLKWKKIYIKNIDGKDVIFEGILEGDTYDSTESPTQKEVQRIESKEYLDKIRQSTINKENEKMWETLVRSFSAEKE